jgi:hypothetical protein
MQAELNKYFPTDISNLILEKHYKSMFSQSIVKMKKESEACRIHYYESSDSEEDTDDSDDEDDSPPWENVFVSQFIRCMLFEPKQKIRRRENAIRIKKEEQRKNKRVEELMEEGMWDWMSPEQRRESLRSYCNVFYD